MYYVLVNGDSRHMCFKVEMPAALEIALVITFAAVHFLACSFYKCNCTI